MIEAPSPCGHRLALSEEQLRVLETWRAGAPLLVVDAKAGTGKTRTAAALACFALATGRRVLLVSFTKNGVKELAAELTRQHGLVLERVTESHWRGGGLVLRTFDSMLAWTLGQIGVDEAGQERARCSWQVRELQRIGGPELRRSGQDEGLWTQYNYDFQLRELCDLVARNQPLSDAAEQVVAPAWAILRQRAHQSRLILPADYDRLVIAHSAGIARLLAERFDLVVVDEDQDSSSRDLAPMIEARHAGRLAQIHFGDPGQAVMGFRGAVGDTAGAFSSAGCCPEVLALTVNRRSSPEIVLASNSIQRASGWSGPLALSHPSSPRGPGALLALVEDETMAVDALMVLLGAAGLASVASATDFRLPGDLALAIQERGAALAEFCGERTPLVEIICPTNPIAEQIVAALEERGVEPAWVRSVANPYDSMVSTLLSACFDIAGDAVEQVRMILTAHTNAWVAGTELAAREELRACATVLLEGIQELPRATDRQSIAEFVLTLAQKINDHQNVGHEGRRYAERAALLVRAFSEAPYAPSVEEMLVALEQALLSRPRLVSRRRTVRPRVSLLEELASAGLRPAEVPGWLDDQARRWRLTRIEEPTAGVLVKTPEVAKGDTCDAAVVHHAELLPRRERRSVLAAHSLDALAAPAQSYIPVSRPRYIYLGLACGSLPRYHDVPLDGWTYLDARCGASRWRRPT